MAERALSTDLKKLLLNNEPFTYAHLVKFERPSKELLNGTFSTDAKRYAYYTDSAFNISYNDGSLDTNGNANGAQTYIADKILEVGTYSETIEAKASGMNIKLSSESFNNSITDDGITMTSSTITVPSHFDLANEGFREGDKVLITGGSNNGHEVRVLGIKTNNTVLVVQNIDSTLGTQSSGTNITLQIVSDELAGPLGEVNDAGNLKSYHNREVFVYKAFLDGASIVGEPVLIFKGIIQSASLDETPNSNVNVTWNLTSHWGDFAAVKGRMSNDAIHRAVDAQNRGQPAAAAKPEYANDLGFMHAEQTTNILATYTAIEQEMRIKVKKKWGGLKTKVKTWMEDVEVQREVNLDFSLSSHFIPVVYGIDRIEGKPIFVDTKSNDPNNIFIAYTLCEGEIGGLYDLYIDGNPLICINKEDSDDRNDATGASKDNVEVFCRGRQDLGNTLGGISMSGTGVSGSTRTDYSYGDSFRGRGSKGFRSQFDEVDVEDIEYYTPNTTLLNTTATDSNGGGVLHGETIKLSAPNTMRLTLHTGKEDQKADNTLTSIAVSPKFKRQVDYFDSSNDGFQYWSPQHKLLDTAYVVLDCEIAEDATTVPEIEYIVRGKAVSCYNYDYSYDHAGTGGQSHSNFKVGDQVTLKKTSDNSTLNSNVTIIDKWSFVDANGNIRYRFRYSDAPDLNYSDGIPGVTAFYHTDGTNSWNMVTWNHIAESGTVPATLSVTTTVTATSGQALTANTGSNPNWLNNPYSGGEYFNFFFVNPALSYKRKNFPFKKSGTTLTATGTNAAGATGGTQTIVSADKIKLATAANSADNAYNDYTVELTKTFTDSTGTRAQKVKRLITAYDGSERVATVSAPWPEGMAPDPDDVTQEAGAVYTYRLLPKSTTDDRRITLNPAMQLLDYMTAKTYGKDLDIDKDIALSDFLLSARTCDDTGTQTLLGMSNAQKNAVSVGERYALTSDGTTSGSVVAMGLVKSKGTDANGVNYIELQECWGKFSKRFMRNSHSYSVGDIVYTGSASGYHRVSSAGALSSPPSGSLTSIPIYKVSNGSISSTKFDVSLNTGGYNNYVGVYNTATGGYDTGYSLFDSDNVKYWRYLGWNSHHQREVTRHQCMGSVDTSQSVFANINGFLKNFNGLLSYEAGQYALRIETTSDAITSQIATSSDSGYTPGAQKNARWIDESDIIGKISIKDSGTKKSYNTVSTSIEDPGNQFKNTAVTFYDSNYLRADKNVIKTGNVNIPAVASYYNARINVENFLRKSRFGLSISFTMGPKALMLIAGETIAFSHDKFGWNGKKFRITNISYNKNCNASITAEEYDDSFYTITAPNLPSVSGNDQRQGLQASPGQPGSPTATAGALGTINISWTNNSTFTDNMFTEIWSGPDSNVNNRTLLTKTDGATAKFADNVGSDNTERYYWIRHGKRVVLTSGGQNKVKVLYSDFVGPDNATTVIPSTWYKVAGSTNFSAFKFSADGNTKTPSSITITADRVNLSGAATFTATNNSGASVTLTGSGDTRALTSANFGSADYVNIVISVTSTTEERNAGADNTYTDTVTVQKVQDGLVGSNGSDAQTVKLTADDYSIVYDAAGSNPSPSSSITLTATAQGITDPYFKFTGDGISDEGTFTDGSGTSDTFTFSVPSSHFTTPKSIRVGVSEADQTEVAFDTISLFAVKPGQQGVDGAEPVTKEFTVTVAGGKFVINGTSQKELTLLRGFTYTFDQSASSNSSHPIRFSTTSNGTHGGGSAYTSGVTHTGTPGSSGALTTFKVPSDAPASLYYYCSNHSGMGGEVNTQDLGSGVTIICTNESHAIPADNDGGNPVMTGSGTSFEVFRGNTQLTGITSGTPGADQFKVTVTSDTNITAGAQSASSQAIVFADHTSMSASTANILYSINIENTQTVTKKQTFSRTNKGNTGQQGSAGLKVKEMEIYYLISSWTYGSNASWPSTPSTGTYNFGTDVLSSIPTGWSRTKETGIGKLYSISRALVTESSSGSGVSSSITWGTPSFSESGFSDTNYIFKYNNGVPNTPSGTSYPNLPSGWSDDIPSAVSGQQLYSSKGHAKLSGSGTNFQFNYTWGTPVLHVTDKADIALGNVDNESSATIRGGNITGTIGGVANTTIRDGVDRARNAINTDNRIIGDIWDGSNTFTPAELLRVRGGFDGLDGTPTLKVANANASLRNSGITLSASGALSGAGGGSITKAGVGVPTIFRQTSAPTSIAAGDLWFDTDDGNKLYRATSAGNDEVAANEWVAVIDEGSARGRAGLAANGDVDRAVPTGKGGTGETNTNRFLNSGISISAGSSGVMTLNRGGYTADTTTITKSNLGLSYDDGATVGAIAGTNLKDSSNNTLSDVDVRNSDLDIDYSGTTVRIKKGSTVIQTAGAPDALKNAQITTNADGTLNYDGTAATTPSIANIGGTLPEARGGTGLTSAGNAIVNSRIQMNSNGTLNYSAAGTGAVSKAGLNLDYDDGATVGAVAGTNLKQANGTVLSDVDVRNSDLDIDYSGTTVRIKKGTTLINSAAAPDGLKNDKVTTNADGTLNYDGTTAVAPNINNIPDAGNTKTYAGYAGTGLDSNGRLKTSIISGGTAITVADLKDTKVRTFAGFDSSGVVKKVVPKTYGGLGEDLSSKTGVLDFSSGTANFRATLPRERGGFGSDVSGVTGVPSFSSGTPTFNATIPTTFIPTIPTSLGGTGVTDTSAFLNSEIDSTIITNAGGVSASSLAYGEIASSTGATAVSWSHNGTAYTPTATTQTITLTITHPTFGTSTVVGTWTRTNFTISGFALASGSGMSGSGTNTWTFGDVNTDSGSADNAFGSTTANYGIKTLYVQHSASNKRIEITSSVLNLNFGGGSKCLTPAMLPENLQIGDYIDSPLGETKVVDLIRKEREGYYILEDELEITNDHPILIDGEWILAEEYAGKKEYIDKPTEVIYVETENELLTVKGWTVGGKY